MLRIEKVTISREIDQKKDQDENWYKDWKNETAFLKY